MTNIGRSIQSVQTIDDMRRVGGRWEEALISLQRRVDELEEDQGYLGSSIVRIYDDHDVGEYVTMVYVGKQNATFTLPAMGSLRFTTKVFFIKNASSYTVTVKGGDGALIDSLSSQTLSTNDTIKVRPDKSDPADMRWWIE